MERNWIDLRVSICGKHAQVKIFDEWVYLGELERGERPALPGLMTLINTLVAYKIKQIEFRVEGCDLCGRRQIGHD